MLKKDFNQKSKVSYNKKAAVFDKSVEGQITHKYHLFMLDNMTVKDDDIVLDVACGTGSLLTALNKATPIRGYGIDLSEQMIAVASKNNPSMEFQVADCEHIPFLDSALDIITVCTAYHHFPDVAAFAHEAYRVIKPTGHIYIAEIYLPPVVRQIGNLFLPLSKSGDRKIYSSQEIIKTLEGAGFRFEKEMRRVGMQFIDCKKE